MGISLPSVSSFPRVSVLLPVYNGRETIVAAVESILNQNMPDFELVIVDDGSTDDTLYQLYSLERSDKRIKIFTRPRLGLAMALNFGLSHCRAPLIARMDADDLSRPDRLKKQAGFLDKFPQTGLVSGQVNYLGDKQKNFGYYLYVRWINSLNSHGEISLNRFIESPLAHPSVMFRKFLTENSGQYADGPFPEDYDLWLRWLELKVKMAKIPEVVLDWRDLDHRLSRVHSNYSFEAFFKLKAGYLAAWLKDNNPHHPHVWVWGAGRRTRQRAEHITGHGCVIKGYIDIRANMSGLFIHHRPVRHYMNLPPIKESFIVVYVRKRDAREEIRRYLKVQGRIEGRDFIVAA